MEGFIVGFSILNLIFISVFREAHSGYKDHLYIMKESEIDTYNKY